METVSQRYRVVQFGGGVEEFDRMQLRDQIRNGAVTSETEISLVGSEDWKAAADFPELKRYFALAGTTSAASGMVYPTQKAPRVVEPMGQRIIRGFLYPVAGTEILTMIGFAVLMNLPFIGLFASLASTVFMLAIIRESAEGRTKMPPMVDTSDLWELIVVGFKTLFVTIVSLAPPLGVWALLVSLHIGAGGRNVPMLLGLFLIALAVAALYYPACIATVAVWNNVLSSLNPVYVLRVIRTVGTDYFIVVAMWFVATSAAAILSSPTINPFRWIPLVGGMIESFLSLWALFYASHLLGYAIYRHAPELGWE